MQPFVHGYVEYNIPVWVKDGSLTQPVRDIRVTLNTYIHLNYDDTKEELQKVVGIDSKKSTMYRSACRKFFEFTTNDGKNKPK